MPDVEPKPDLADAPMKPAPEPDAVTDEEEPVGENSADPPAEDLTLPME